MPEHIIRASEIGQYDFCARAWWLHSVEGLPSSNVRELQAGTQAHQAHGRRVSRAGLLQQSAILLLIAGVILLAIFILSSGL
jgi:hypothetical protein